MTTVKAFAPAKINLTLHVIGQRPDGYHLLESLVVFADFGDRLTLRPASETSLSVTGPMSEAVPVDERNLAVRAANLAGETVRIELEKVLPAAAGIGGGSSDAAAVLRGIQTLTGAPLPADQGLALGADVPVCLLGRAACMSGIGEKVEPIIGFPRVHAVLVNPGVVVPTGQVFDALASKANKAMDSLPEAPDFEKLCDWLARQRNDLEAPAKTVQPIITQVLDSLSDARIARMSGSGATCFGLYPDEAAAHRAETRIRSTNQHWWVQRVKLS